MTLRCDTKIYPFEEKKPWNTNIAVRNEINNGKRILYVSKVPLPILKSQLDAPDHLINLKWFSARPEPDCVSPLNVEALSRTIKEFISHGPNGVIVLNGIDVMSNWTYFSKIYATLQNIKQIVSQNDHTLIITIDPTSIDARKLHLLETLVDKIVSKKSKSI